MTKPTKLKKQKYFGYSIDPVELQDINKIGVLCSGLIGDVFMRVPIIEALKQRFPQAKITVIVDPAAKDVLSNHPDCHKVIILRRKKRPFFRYLFNNMSKVLWLRRQHFDLFVNLYSGGSSTTITRLVNARIRLGFDHTKALRWSNNLLVTTPSFCEHWTVALGKKLVPLGIGDNQIRRGSSFHITEAASQRAVQLLPEQSRYLAINLGAGKEVKRWPVASFVELAEKISKQHGLIPVVLTNPGMEQLSTEFVAQYRGECIKLPVLSLTEVGAVMQRCVALITGDTSIMHMAFGVKVPNMVLFTDTRPEIVEPEDCMHVACFIEDPENINSCGKPSGTVKIPVNYAYQRFEILSNMLEKPQK